MCETIFKFKNKKLIKLEIYYSYITDPLNKKLNLNDVCYSYFDKASYWWESKDHILTNGNKKLISRFFHK